MHTRTTAASLVSAVLVLGAFAAVAANYQHLPTEMPVLLDLAGRPLRLAARSPLTALRVPAINLVAAAAALLMLRRAPVIADPIRRAAYVAMFAALAVTVGVKAALEAGELVALSAPRFSGVAPWLRGALWVVVFVGIATAVTCGRTMLWPADPREWALEGREKAVLLLLLAVYVAVGVLPILGSHRVPGT
jgi:hypothetical protein